MLPKNICCCRVQRQPGVQAGVCAGRGGELGAGGREDPEQLAGGGRGRGRGRGAGPGPLRGQGGEAGRGHHAQHPHPHQGRR